MSIRTITCEMCGKEIPLRASVEVRIEGAVMRICPSCFARYSAGRGAKIDREKEQTTTRVEKPLPPPPKKQPRRERIERYEIVKDYHERIRSARESMGLTTKDLAIRIRESENIVKRIESGKLIPPIELARRIENVLKIQLVVPAVDQEIEEKAAGKTGKDIDLTLGDIVQVKKKG
ncbi:MAG TPA: multiprotein bridging factor aMBF1 [Sulfolobales archaeon]|nr:multiprotein bridging factor aMBF1 [Sulfolobales archaeon]